LHRTDVGENNPTFMASRPCKAGQPPRFRPVAIPPSRGSSKETAVDKAYLEDLAPGQVFTSDARTVVDADAIKRFGGEFDPQPWHLNEAVAHSTFFKELVASGWHTTALTMQLIIQTLPLSGGIIGSGVDELPGQRHGASAHDHPQSERSAGANHDRQSAGIPQARAGGLRLAAIAAADSVSL
jgi:hypothetical protein